MCDTALAPLRAWLVTPMSADVSHAIDRLRRAPDVQHVAVMPDVHLANDVCIGVAVATSRAIYPQAVGGDIGCGMLAVASDLDAAALRSGAVAGRVLAAIGRSVPARRRNRRDTITAPSEVTEIDLSDPALDGKRRQEGTIEFGTLGSGNHFLELQADEDQRLWLMVHSGSRAMGPAIRDHHLARADAVGGGLRKLDADSDGGRAYLHDARWAQRYADASRRAMACAIGDVLATHLSARLCWETVVTTDHNHVARVNHEGRTLWIHRKGAMSAQHGEHGVLPGSMGTESFHVEGRGVVEALCSSAHGAGRALSRTEARRRITERELRRQMDGVWYDYRLSGQLSDEAPAAYKDIRAVLRAQHDLVKVTRVLRPVLSYKGP